MKNKLGSGGDGLPVKPEETGLKDPNFGRNKPCGGSGLPTRKNGPKEVN
jgi:hypothetical protein